MLKIKIITLGKIKNKDLKNAISKFEKRLSKYAKLEVLELNDLPISEKPSQSEIDICLEKESIEIKKRLSDKSYTFTLCIEGKKVTSEGLSKMISDISQNYSEINFVIGSSYGISDKIKKESDFKLSMSDMTFPHNIARLMLTEQIYRAFKIQKGESYHK